MNSSRTTRRLFRALSHQHDGLYSQLTHATRRAPSSSPQADLYSRSRGRPFASTSSHRLASSNRIHRPQRLDALRSLYQLVADAARQDVESPESLVTITASVQTRRKHSKIAFLALNDGSLPGGSTLQAVIRTSLPCWTEGDMSSVTPGTSVQLTGTIQQSRGSGQSIEFKVESGKIVGPCATSVHPLLSQAAVQTENSTGPSQRATQTSLPVRARQHLHLRSQTTDFAATTRLRARLEAALGRWLDDRDYVQTRPPILTSNDCEGGGEVFRVMGEAPEPAQGSASGTQDLASQRNDASPASTAPAGQTFLSVSSQLHLESLMLGLGRVYAFAPAFRAEKSATNRHLREFWMLEVELATNAVSSPSDSSEGAMRIASSAKEELDQVMSVVEDLIKSAGRDSIGIAVDDEVAADRRQERARIDAQYLFNHANHRGESVSEEASSQAEDKLPRFLSDQDPWPRLSYTSAIRALQGVYDEYSQSSTASALHDALFAPLSDGNQGKRVAAPSQATIQRPSWGDSLSSEQERFLSARYDSPVFVYDYPAKLKPFYMRVGWEDVAEDEGAVDRTAQDPATRKRQVAHCFDLLIPDVGEVVGGSLREDDPSTLERRMKECGLINNRAQNSDVGQDGADADATEDALAWYWQSLRKYGMPPHGGFGIGMERLVMWLAYRDNVRECLPFPRFGDGPVRY